MPLLSARKPRSISQSIAALLGSSADLNANDVATIDGKAANTAYHSALAQKAFEEVKRERESAQMRSDPEMQARYGSNVAGITEPQGSQLSKALRGVVAEQPVANDDEGNALPPAPYQMPSDVNPAQVRTFQTAIASTLANLLATGKTNADQMTQAGGNLLTQGIRERIAAEPNPAVQNQLGAAIKPGYREPYSGGVNAQGITTNQETGAANVVSQPLLDASLKALDALASQRESSATAAEARALAAEARAALTRAGGRGVAQPKPPTGYRWAQDDNGEPVLEPIPGGPKDASGGPTKPLPSSAAKSIFENQQNLRRAEQALALINGAEVRDTQGNVVAKGDKDATGFKGFVPDALLQRMDSGGNATRAAIADLGSLIIHDRSGAAVTAAEFPRLQPFIPSAKDDPATVRTKLNRFVQEYRNVTNEMADFYSQSGYKVPAETLRSSGATPASAATPSQRGASGSYEGNDRRTQQRGKTNRVVVDY